jgi:hypothetical protein
LGIIDACTSGDEVVRYPMSDGCVDNGGGVSKGLRTQSIGLETRGKAGDDPSQEHCTM